MAGVPRNREAGLSFSLRNDGAGLAGASPTPHRGADGEVRGLGVNTLPYNDVLSHDERYRGSLRRTEPPPALFHTTHAETYKYVDGLPHPGLSGPAERTREIPRSLREIRVAQAGRAPSSPLGASSRVYFRLSPAAARRSGSESAGASGRCKEAREKAKGTLDLYNSYTRGLHRTVRSEEPLAELERIEALRAANRRVLEQEEEKIRMECTCDLVDGVHRRYLPSTIGRRNPLLEIDVQDAHNRREGLRLLTRSGEVLAESGAELGARLGGFYAAANV